MPVCFLEMRETLNLLAMRRTNQLKNRVKAEKGDQIDGPESMGRGWNLQDSMADVCMCQKGYIYVFNIYIVIEYNSLAFELGEWIQT